MSRLPGFLRRLCLPMLFAAAAGAQTPAAPSADRPPDTPTQAAVHHDAALNPALPTVFIVGDSTARNNADLGWGDHFAPLFDTARINVANRAIAGRSSRTFINEGHWQKVLDEIKAGDFVLIQMGHNDGGDLGGAKPRGSIKGIGDESQDVPQTAGPFAGKIETVHSYGWYLRKMIDEAKAKGAQPILLTLTVRNIWKPGPDGKPHIERDMGYTGYEQQVATAEHIPLVDMATCAANRFEALGQEKTAALFPVDHTHTSAEGAAINAGCVGEALRQAHSPLAAYLAPQTSANHPAEMAFEVATIKPIQHDPKGGRYFRMEGTHRWVAKDYTLKLLLAAAYDLNPRTVLGGPAWLDSDHFDIVATTPGTSAPSRDEQMTMLRRLLTERFDLKFHREEHEYALYRLELAKDGPKLKPSAAAPEDPPKLIATVYDQKLLLPARNATMRDFTAMLQRAILDRPVVDKTGLTGRYDFDLTWAPDETQFGGEVGTARDDAPSSPLFVALQQQLGLKLVAARGPVDALVVDHAALPVEN